MLQGGYFDPAGLGLLNVKCTVFTHRNVLATVRSLDVQKDIKSTLHIREAEALVWLLNVLGFKLAQFSGAFQASLNVCYTTLKFIIWRGHLINNVFHNIGLHGP